MEPCGDKQGSDHHRPAAADPAGNLNGVGKAGGRDEAHGRRFPAVTQAPGFIGKVVGIAVAPFMEGFQGEEEGVVRGVRDGAQGRDLAAAVPATAGMAGRNFLAAEGAVEGHGAQRMKNSQRATTTRAGRRRIP